MMGGGRKKKSQRVRCDSCARIHPRDSVRSCKSTCRLLRAYLAKSEEEAGGLEDSAADKQEDLQPPDAAGEV